MSSNRKVLKLISFAQAIIAISAIIYGVIALTGVSELGSTPQRVLGVELHASAWMIIDDVVLLLLSVLMMTAAALGIRGANRPSSLGAHGASALIGALAAVLCGLLSFSLGETVALVLAAVAAVLNLASAVLGRRVRSELDR